MSIVFEPKVHCFIAKKNHPLKTISNSPNLPHRLENFSKPLVEH